MTAATHPQLLVRTATFERAQIDRAARTVPASLSSEEPVVRYGAEEVLSHDAVSVDLVRAVGGLPLLYCHDKTQPVGVVENVRIEGRRLVGTLRFGQSAKAREVFQDVEDGVIRGVSVGYLVHEQQMTERGYVATKWTPYEASVIATPADITVGIGRGADLSNPNHQEVNMHETLQTRAVVDGEIRALTQRHGLDAQFTAGLIARGLTLEQARPEILDALARRDLASGGHLNIRTTDGGAERAYNLAVSRTGVDPMQAEQQRELMVEALAARAGGARMQGENPYAHARVTDLARDCLELRGVNTRNLSSSQVIERAISHTTGDFPLVLLGAGNRILRNAYEAAPTIKRVFRQATVADFRAKQRLAMSEAPALLKVNEGGEFKSGTMAEVASTYSLSTYGRMFGISRQALVNDDLDAFGQMAVKFGRAAAEFENSFLVNLLTSNPAMYDNVSLFAAGHGNLGSGAPSALSLTSLAAARQSMRLQKGIDGTTPIDATPSFLIVPAALETTAQQLVTQITPNQTSAVNPFAGRLDVVVDPRLDALSATAWYLAADPALIDTIEYSYLDSEPGPQLFTRDGFEVDGVEMKVRLDFGAGVIDWRGLYKSNGA